MPDGVRTKHDGSKSKSLGLPATKRPLFMRFIVGFLGGTSGGADGVTPSRRKPEKKKKKRKNLRKEGIKLTHRWVKENAIKFLT